MPNANHGTRRSSSTSSDIKGSDNTSQRDEIMTIHSHVLEMIEILERRSAILELIESQSTERMMPIYGTRREIRMQRGTFECRYVENEYNEWKEGESDN
ncbi:hypothetical protein ACJ73_06298 [Blastomyces percursus]|uniref:Uncharacterized protein n=1 Tax=Blastomyces percursus TaxID=1658174 RepID=A0A1J9QQ76_9EURO|nr:hypothetical protein ACJ73_06298 [Blastomyces percursus]